MEEQCRGWKPHQSTSVLVCQLGVCSSCEGLFFPPSLQLVLGRTVEDLPDRGRSAGPWRSRRRLWGHLESLSRGVFLTELQVLNPAAEGWPELREHDLSLSSQTENHQQTRLSSCELRLITTCTWTSIFRRAVPWKELINQHAAKFSSTLTQDQHWDRDSDPEPGAITSSFLKLQHSGSETVAFLLWPINMKKNQLILKCITMKCF